MAPHIFTSIVGDRFILSKKDRIRSKRIFESLFKDGISLFVHPLKMVYISLHDDHPAGEVLFGVSVPKRIHRKAVIRNLLKRRIRNAFRINKPWMADRLPSNKRYAVLYIYLSKEVEDYQTIENALKRLNRKWIKALHKG